MKPFLALHPHLALMPFVPRIRLSRPPPIDNTEHVRYETGEVVEPARSILCFDCQLPIHPGGGVQVRRYLRADNPRQTAAIVHAQCGRLGVQAG